MHYTMLYTDEEKQWKFAQRKAGASRLSIQKLELSFVMGETIAVFTLEISLFGAIETMVVKIVQYTRCFSAPLFCLNLFQLFFERPD